MTGEARPRVVISGGRYAARRIRREPDGQPPGRFGALASWWFAFTRDLRRERTFTSRDVGVLHDVYGADPQQLISATKTASAPVPPPPPGPAGPGKPAPRAPAGGLPPGRRA